MRIAIHQPNFLPWMGYFYKIAQSDVFVFLDHVKYTKQSFTKRVKIHKARNHSKDQYLSVPLKKHSDYTPINELSIANHINWKNKMYGQIYSTYHKAPYFDQLVPLLESFFNESNATPNLSEFNISLIKYVSSQLNLNPKWVLSSELDGKFTGKNLNVDIVCHLNGAMYISGQGAKKYQNETLFSENSIDLKYSNFKMKFQSFDLPEHFYNKSILSYLACFEIQEIRSFLK